MKSLAAGVVGMVMVACGPTSPSVDIVGQPPGAQAATLADALCDQEAKCGLVSVNCSTVCEGTIERTTYEACYADAEPTFRADLEQCALTAAEERQLQDCINARLDESCISQSEIDAYVAKLNAGEQDADIRPPIPACVGIASLFDGC